MNTAQYRPSDLLRGRAIPDGLLAALPKTDLHSHLDGCLRLETFRELAQAEGMAAPADDDVLRKLYFPSGRECHLEDFLSFFDNTLAVLQTPENLERVAYEQALDYSAAGVWCMEVRFCPILHNEKGMTPDGAVAAVKGGLVRAEKETGMRTGIIVTGIRTIEPARSLELARLAVAWKERGVVAFDLAGAEEDHPAKRHQEAFYHVLNNNQNITIHAGEEFGPESIHQALHRCGANRIGHGTRLEEDQDLMAYVTDHRIPLEMCLTSNLQTCVVDDLRDHPFRHYLKHGLRVCLNCDNTLFAQTDPMAELRLAVDTFDLTLLETEHLLLNGFKSAFIPEQEKGKLVQEALRTMTSLRDKYGLDDVLMKSD